MWDDDGSLERSHAKCQDIFHGCHQSSTFTTVIINIISNIVIIVGIHRLHRGSSSSCASEAALCFAWW